VFIGSLLGDGFSEGVAEISNNVADVFDPNRDLIYGGWSVRLAHPILDFEL
jgi:hypothetical protein